MRGLSSRFKAGGDVGSRFQRSNSNMFLVRPRQVGTHCRTRLVLSEDRIRVVAIQGNVTTPRNPPIVIPPEGGSFRYDLNLVNESNVTRTIDIWVVLNGPGLQRTLVLFSRTLAPGARFHRTFTQAIPGSASAGTYTVVGNADVSYARGERSIHVREALSALTIPEFPLTLRFWRQGDSNP